MSLIQELLSLTPEELGRNRKLIEIPSTPNSECMVSTPLSTSTSETFQNEDSFTDSTQENNNSIIIPNWIIQNGSHYQFNPTTFDVSSIGGQDIIDLFSEEVVISSFASFDFQIKKLAGKIKTELDSFYSTDSNPKPTGKMTSTERHYLAAIVAKEYPQLITRYQEFKEQHRKGEDLGRMIYATTFKSNFMDFFISKLNNKEKHVPKRLLELNGPRELKKKKVSEAMKISAKEFPRRQKKCNDREV
ncbi:hypothetical protein TYRP_020579 [Tyrophagus putrescentiae]|nr:hypothetical protein TYRP_020579 [Tyrophagus putrescentiae]